MGIFPECLLATPAWRIELKKRFLKALTIWGGIDATICAGLLIYSAIKAIQIDLDNHKWALEQKVRPATDPFLQDIPEIKISRPDPLGKAFTQVVR